MPTDLYVVSLQTTDGAVPSVVSYAVYAPSSEAALRRGKAAARERNRRVSDTGNAIDLARDAVTTCGVFIETSDATCGLVLSEKDRDWLCPTHGRVAVRRHHYLMPHSACDDENQQLRARVEELEAQLRTVQMPETHVWRWMGDGRDDPASLSCPVVMAPETLRRFVDDAAENEQLRKALTLAAPYCANLPPRQPDHCDSCRARQFIHETLQAAKARHAKAGT